MPQLARLWPRIGGPQIRQAGTILGNIANGSPIGDGPPVWIALDAWLTLRHGSARRRLPIEAFFLAYGKQDLRPGEFIEELSIPVPAPGAILAAHKVSKRHDEDISALMGAFHIQREGGLVTGARIAFGGMAGIPLRAAGAEAALVGRPWTPHSIQDAATALARDFQPLSDMRASAGYRLAVAQNLLHRVWLDSTGHGTDLRGLTHV